jgi:hypothetical protein
MKKLALAGVALLVAGSAFAQNPFPGQFPGQGRGDRDGWGRNRGGFDRCGWDRGSSRDPWSDLKSQIQDVIQDAKDISAVAEQRFSGAEAGTFNDGRVVDAYLAVGSLKGQAEATLTMTQANDWNNWDRFNQFSDRANVGQAVDNLQRAANTIRNNDAFSVYNNGRFGLGQRLDCDIQDLRRITDAVNEDWRRGRPGGPGFPGGGGRGPGFPGGPGGGGRGPGFPGGPGQRVNTGSAWVQVSLDSYLEVVIGPNGPRVGQNDMDPQGRTKLLGGQVNTNDRRNDSFRNPRNITVTPRHTGNNGVFVNGTWIGERITYTVTTDPRTGEIRIMFRDAAASSGTDTFDISWQFD